MKSALVILLRVKTLKEERALQEANARRAQAQRAAEAAQRAKTQVQESLATLESRQDAIYRDILGRVVKLDAIEITKARIVMIEKEHGKLVDAQDRAVHIQAEADAARESAIQSHRHALKSVDKYKLLTDRERDECEALAQRREESEIEDLFSTKRRGPS